MLSLTAAALVTQLGLIDAAVAQVATDASAEEKKAVVEEITVTGTRVKRKDLTTPAPVAVLSREQILSSGKVSLGDFLQTLPEQGNTVNAQVNNGNDGSVRVNLRSLGSNRTLVLVNGRRFVAGGTGADSGVDLNSIPAAAVERIEILKDGASAIYGSDAIAGVVNIITKRHLDKFEVSTYIGQSSRSDGRQYDLSASTGGSNDRGSFVLSVGFQKNEKVLAGDRSYAKEPYLFNYETGQPEVTTSSPTTPIPRFSIPSAHNATNTGTCDAGYAGTRNAALQSLCDLYNNNPTNPNRNQFVPNGSGGYQIWDGSGYNSYPTNYLHTPGQRAQVYFTADTNLGNFARGFTEVSYVNRASSRNLAPMPVSSGSTGVVISRDNAYNPFGVDISSWRIRTAQFGNRDWFENVDTFRTVMGVDGSLGDWAGPLRGWSWEVYYNFGRTTGQVFDSGQLNMYNVGKMLGATEIDPTTGQLVCVDQSIPGCVPMNVLGANLTPEQYKFGGYRGISKGLDQSEQWAVNVGGEIVRLWSTRPVSLAVGAEWRRDSGQFIPDPIAAAGMSSGNNQDPTSGKYTVKEFYGELAIPLAGDMPFIRELELSLAARRVDYSTFGTNNTYKIGARFSPIREVTLRGTYGTAFRAPNVGELYASGVAESFDFTPNGDPCQNVPAGPSTLRTRCEATGLPVGSAGSGDTADQFRTLRGANADLSAEKAKIFTVGVVFEPQQWVRGLSLTADYYKIDLDNAVTFLSAPVILEGCYSGGSNAYCQKIHRDADGVISAIDDKLSNAQSNSTDGIDVAAKYNLPIGGVGTFDFGLDATFLGSYKQTNPDGTKLSGKGYYGQDLGNLPSVKYNLGARWSRGGANVGAFARYIGGMTECESTSCSVDKTNSRKVASFTTVDLSGGYLFRSSLGATGLTVGIQNVADAAPPRIYSTGNYTTDLTTYPVMGRFFFARVSHTY
ncbi:MAG: TonB-dependent receptor [Deltaproteobacteria bacterium]|nr:TonB-dependent receptor [Deltaproteobacteria bacterium]